MIDIAQHIEYLLLYHDCVVVPGFGAFMINRESARYDAVSGLYLPPSSALGFNPEVRHNDALLIGSISRREGVTIDSARASLDTVIASLLHQLRTCGELPFGSLGVFTSGESDEAPVFVPSLESLPVRIYDGLHPLTVNPLVPDNVEDIQLEMQRPAVVIPLPLKVVASIIAIIVSLGILYSTTSLVNGPRVSFASLDTGISSHIERVLDSSLSVSRVIMLNIAIPAEKKEVSAESSIVGDTTAERKIVDNTPERYLLVVGSFPSMKAASRHISNVGDENLRVIEMDGNFRIYAASASRIDDARTLAHTLSERYPNVWVCRR